MFVCWIIAYLTVLRRYVVWLQVVERGGDPDISGGANKQRARDRRGTLMELVILCTLYDSRGSGKRIAERRRALRSKLQTGAAAVRLQFLFSLH